MMIAAGRNKGSRVDLLGICPIARRVANYRQSGPSKQSKYLYHSMSNPCMHIALLKTPS